MSEAEAPSLPLSPPPAEAPSQEPERGKDGREESVGRESEGADMEVAVPQSESEGTQEAPREKEPSRSPVPTPTSSLASPLLPLPDFMTALNMQLAGGSAAPPAQGAGPEGVAPGHMEGEPESQPAGLSLGPGSKEVLVEKFKKDPSSVLELLQSALSIEKLTSLLSDEHKGNSELLLELQNKLEASYYTLKECENAKTELAEKITSTNVRVEEKKRHLEELRGDLKILGNEEMKLKRKRQVTDSKYFEVKKVLTSSVDALEQISRVSKAFPRPSLPDTVSPPPDTPTNHEGEGPSPTTPPEGEDGVGDEQREGEIVENGRLEEEVMEQEA